jgi:tRNA (cytidine/uridine-2'-O-)-methyltransferase
MRLALYAPDIPQNTGTILRLCACMGVPADLIGPIGFDASDRTMRRAGMDYLDQVEITRHLCFSEFDAARRKDNARVILLTTQAKLAYSDFVYEPSDILLLGRESAGAPDEVHASADARVTIPMRPGMRSVNVALAAAMVLGEALRQTNGFPRVQWFEGTIQGDAS